MTTSRDRMAKQSGAVETVSISEDGWYLYGITRHESGGESANVVSVPGQSVQVLECENIAAIVSPVSTDDFSAETLAARAEDIGWLESVVRAHNEVIAAVHARQTILPAKFGSVYTGLPDLKVALEQMQEPLLRQLEQLEGTDEWAVHVYADRSMAREYVAAHDAGTVALERELNSARPGRAYFLQRKLKDYIATATENALNGLAQTAFDDLSAHAVAAQVNPPGQAGVDSTRVEVLRAAFLVSRTDSDNFLGAAENLRDDEEGLDVEVTGPWPPYSFARIAGDVG